MRKILFILLAITLGFAFSSCKSTPETPSPAEAPREELPKEEPPKKEEPKLSVEALNSAAARAEAARKLAMDFEAPAYFPGDWEKPEAQYNEAGTIPHDSKENIQKATEMYDEATSLYEEIFDNTIPLYSQAREDEIMSVRGDLLDSSFALYFPELIDGADAVALDALDKYEKKDYYGAKDSAAKSLNMYETLSVGADAFRQRQEIVRRGFEAGDPQNFARADMTADSAVEFYTKGDYGSARGSADEAGRMYGVVLTKGWAVFVNDLKAASDTERQNALNVRGNVASRNEFNDADTIYQQAVALMEAGQSDEAGILFEQSSALFAEVVRITAEKRALAEAIIREAEERAEASDEAARRAEEIIEGGEQ